jgi:hypothetical protein
MGNLNRSLCLVLVLSTLSGCVAQRADTGSAPVTLADKTTPNPSLLESILSMSEIAAEVDSLSYVGYKIDKLRKAARYVDKKADIDEPIDVTYAALKKDGRTFFPRPHAFRDQRKKIKGARA